SVLAASIVNVNFRNHQNRFRVFEYRNQAISRSQSSVPSFPKFGLAFLDLFRSLLCPPKLQNPPASIFPWPSHDDHWFRIEVARLGWKIPKPWSCTSS